jgi:predicted GH43/DUF377 family glycosyl hydrolase
MNSVEVERTNIRIYADDKKVLLRHLNFGLNPDRIDPIIDYIKSLDVDQITNELKALYRDFEHRHFDLRSKFVENFRKISSAVDESLSEEQELLLGAYFTHEYSIQASALFNPSIVPHPDQSGLQNNSLRFLMSLRATGEGHISSVAFMTGVLNNKGEISMDETSRMIAEGEIKDLDESYEVTFDASKPLSSRVLFPHLPSESMGMEDVRFVHLENEDLYIGTYTAYDGRSIAPQLISTKDFIQFKIGGFKGNAIKNKGLALFPRKVNGKYVMIGRQDGRSLSIMYSKDLREWNNSEHLQHPKRGWEMLQIGNNGSPIETEKGWLLLTHAVGPMRKYTLSMTLLDLENPSIVTASLDLPLMRPNDEEREGYVPNVLYTCGMLAHQGMLIIPYAMSDSAISFAKVEIEDVLNKLTR